MKDFDYKIIKELADKAIDPYLVSIEQALQAPQNRNIDKEPRSALVKQMFIRSLRLISFDFSNEVDKHLYQLYQIEMAQAKKEKAKQEKSSISNAPKKAISNQKKTLKELREERAKKQQNANQED